MRVDRCGFVAALVGWLEHKTTGQKPKLKAEMEAGEIVEGDYFEASWPDDGPRSVILGAAEAEGGRDHHPRPARRVLQRVGLVPWKKLVGDGIDAKQFKRLCRTFPGTPRLNIEPRAGREVKLAEALTMLHGAVMGEEARKAA